MNLYIPVLIVVLSNTIYHICAKSTPEGINSFASLTATYGVGAVVSLVLYFATRKEGNLLIEYRQLNWASFMLGAAIVGLEAGFLLMYKAGWGVSTAQIVTSAILAIVLIVVGFAMFHEAITWQKVVGALICLSGLYLINK